MIKQYISILKIDMIEEAKNYLLDEIKKIMI